MEGYPAHYVSHNLPFVTLFGLGASNLHTVDPVERGYPLLQEKGIYISSDLPSVSGAAADALLACFHEFDARDASWNNRPGKGKMGTMGFTYRSVGRAFTLPCRKAKPPEVEVLPDGLENATRKAPLPPVLHSPLSPLTSGSPTFPDGIMTPFWFSKHQYLLPSAMIAFFTFTLDPSSSTLQDNKLKSEINALRTSVAASSYKFRVVVVLVCEEDTSEAATFDRVSNIRRATSLEAKSLFFLPLHMSSIEMKGFVGSVLASIQPTCIEYYRELSKHTRRKRNRGSAPPPTVPPTSGASLLSTNGWIVRYETKLGFFAECRQEMDAAGRNYESAYESLLDRDVFESISHWSPRFDEARLLADALAIRILRCLLWTGQTTSAVQSWTNHRYRIQDVVDRKGKGSANYGWQAWEARWSTVMAELIGKVDVPIFHVPEPDASRPSTAEIDIYAIPEKAFAGEDRLPPWDLLHHEGYWYRRAVQRTRQRRKMALAIPKEDRHAPASSPASHLANQTHVYDTYLCPEPHLEYGLPGHETFDHSVPMIDALLQARLHFHKRQQHRAVERADFEMACEYMRSGRWEEAMAVVKPLWQEVSWRKAGWWKLVEEVSWALRACARHLGDGETLVMVEWELLSNALTPRAGWQYNLTTCLDGLDFEEKSYATIDSSSTAPTMLASFMFGSSIARVGEPILIQLALSFQAHATAAPVTPTKLLLEFEGGGHDLSIVHDTSETFGPTVASDRVELFEIQLGEPLLQHEELSLTKPPALIFGSAHLSFDPAMTKVFDLSILPRKTGTISASRVGLRLEAELFDVDITIPLLEDMSSGDWWYADDGALARRKLTMEKSCSVNVQPKPPRLRITLPSLEQAYYADEVAVLDVLVINDEDDAADIRLDIRLLGSMERAPTLFWDSSISATPLEKVTHAASSKLENMSLGQLAPTAEVLKQISFQALPESAEYVLEITANYHLLADPETPITKTIAKDLVFIGPFEANYSFTPRIDLEPWPSYFALTEPNASDSPTATGIRHKWLLSTKLSSFAVEPLTVSTATLRVVDIHHGAQCHLTAPEEPNPTNTILEPNDHLGLAFPFTAHKLSLDDRRSTTLRVALVIEWHRPSQPGTLTTTTLAIPPFALPFTEPRVLLAAAASPPPSPLVQLAYTVENPSMHLLAFQLTMEASEDFAFAGPKQVGLQLVPLSRETVWFNLLPTRRGAWTKPVLRALDVGFGQKVAVVAANGCELDARGEVRVWVDAE